MLAATVSAAEPASFVRVKGTRFELAGRPYYIVGTNLWYGAWLGIPGQQANRTRLLKELDTLKALGINNLRVLALAEATPIASAVKPPVIKSPGLYDEQVLRGLDYLLSEMARRQMTAVLVLTNFWQWSGGMSQYLSWQEGVPMPNPEVTGNYPAFMANAARFYRSAEANAQYRSAIEMLVNRTNTVTRKVYRDDPAIMAWQLANEPRPGNDQVSADDKAVFARWINDTAQFVHQLDGNHLVSSGSEGQMGSANDGALYEAAHRSPWIDYLTFHLWPRNWGWYAPDRPDTSWNATVQRSFDYMHWHIEMAVRIGKPTVLDEFGLDRDKAMLAVSAPTSFRDKFYRAVLTTIEQEAMRGYPIAGSNFWGWSGSGRPSSDRYRWRSGDAFLGDPPMEEQGLNGVYDSDSTTIRLLKEHAANMKSL